jgi:DNA polymerase-3 subunit delta
MIVTLTGENNFQLAEELNKIVTAFLEDHGDLALERVDAAEENFEKIQESLQSLPFLASKKLVVLRGASANKQFLESAEGLLGELPETTDVVVVEPKLDKRTAYYKFLRKETDFREFKNLDDRALSQWLVQKAKAEGGELATRDAQYLVERVGANQQILASELEKLLLYDAKITRSTIDLLTDTAPQSTVFQLLEAAFAGNNKHALELYGEQRALKVEAQQIVAMLAWQLHVLATIKAAGDRSVDQIAKEARLNPFVVRKSQGIARRLTLAELKKLISDLLEIDIATKRTSIDADEALQHYLLKLDR